MPRILLILALFMILVAACGGNDRRANDPNLSQAHLERAKFFWAHGEVNKTIQEMEWALMANPYNYEAAFNLGLIYLDQGQRISARRVWEEALARMGDEYEEGYEGEDYDNARIAADIRAGLAELEKADRQLGTPEGIMARQQSENQLLSESSLSGSEQTGGATIVTTTRTSDSTYTSRPGLPQQTVHTSEVTQTVTQTSESGQGVTSQTSRPTGPQYQPKPYVPGTQDGKPAASGASAGRAGTRAAECPPCAPQNSGKYAVQVSSNRQQRHAQQDVKRLQDKGYHATMATNQAASGTWHVVWAGCCTSQEQARKLAAQLKQQGLVPADARAAVPK